jgi:hypothetical protein
MNRELRRALHCLLAALSICALAAPAASAVPAEQFFQGADEYERPRPPDATSAPVRVVKVEADAGFDWGDAGIGAIGVVALTAIGVGAAFALGHGRGQRQLPQAIR